MGGNENFLGAAARAFSNHVHLCHCRDATITLPEGVDVPDGTSVEITLPDDSADTPVQKPAPTAKSPALARMLRHAGTVNILSEDFSERHTEYRNGCVQR